jgi:hypothetical protein
LRLDSRWTHHAGAAVDLLDEPPGAALSDKRVDRVCAADIAPGVRA